MAGGGGDRAQRAQHPAGDEPTDRGGGHRDDRQGDAGDDQQLLPCPWLDLPHEARHVVESLLAAGAAMGTDFALLVEREHWVWCVPEQAVEQVGVRVRSRRRPERAAVQDGKA